MNFNQAAKKVMCYPKSHFNEAEKLIIVFLISKLNFPPPPPKIHFPIRQIRNRIH